MAEPVQVSSDDRDGARANARRLVRQKRIFYTIVGIYLSLSIMWFAIDALDDSSSYWFYWPMLGTGLGVVVTGVVLFGLGGLLGADWERRQVKKYVERQNGPTMPEPPGNVVVAGGDHTITVHRCGTDAPVRALRHDVGGGCGNERQ